LLPESTGYQSETAAEFHPDVADEEPSWIAQAKTLMTQLNKSAGHQAATIQNVLDENQTPEDLLAALEAEVADEPIDVEAEPVDEPEDEAPPEDITQDMLNEYAKTHAIPKSVLTHIAKAADDLGLKKGTAKRRAFIHDEMTTWVERQQQASDESAQGALL
jgi:hypothetical protein